MVASFVVVLVLFTVPVLFTLVSTQRKPSGKIDSYDCCLPGRLPMAPPSGHYPTHQSMTGCSWARGQLSAVGQTENLGPRMRDVCSIPESRHRQATRSGPLSAMCGRLRVGKSFFHVLQHWSVQPCVRPFNAVHMTAGHNALRGSGPDQKLAFKNAMAHVGCPDRRIDRLCITCCSPSQPSHHAGCPARSRLSRKRDGFLVSLAPGHHGPDHSGDLVGERDSRNLGWPPRQQGREPGPMFGAMDLGVADDGERAGHEQAAQIAVTSLAYIAEPVLAST